MFNFKRMCKDYYLPPTLRVNYLSYRMMDVKVKIRRRGKTSGWCVQKPRKMTKWITPFEK